MSSSWDVIVAGAGTGGMVLAVFAARRGARVLVLDVAPCVGGALHVSTGQLSAAGTRLQAERGIEDSADAHFQDITRISRGTVDEPLVRLAVENAAATLDWLVENGMEILPEHPVTGQNHEPYSTPRYYWGPERGRSVLAAVVPQFDAEIATGRITLRLETEVVELLRTDAAGPVTGVVAQKTNGTTERYKGQNIVLATGGYNSDSEMFKELNGHKQYADAAYAYARGAGIRLGRSVGGWTRGHENYLCGFGAVLDSPDLAAKVLCRPVHFPERRMPWEVYVNVHGQRFVAEDEPSVDAREHALLRQPELRRFILFDARIAREAPPLVAEWSREKLMAHFGRHPMFVSAPTWEELARRAGIDAASLTETISEYNATLTSEDPWGREYRPLPLAEPPFYAIRVQGMSITSTVGLAVDAELRVLGKGNSPVGALYAIGELLGAGQLMGNAFCGGMLATPAMTFGRLLGQRILTWG